MTEADSTSSAAEIQTLQNIVVEKDAVIEKVTNDLADTLVELDLAEKAIERLRSEVDKMTVQSIEFQRIIQDQRILLRRAAGVMEGWHSLSRYELDLVREMREAINESTFR
jgi:predicted  nucleic acid-binding Zn-ribbon protein